MIQHRVFDKADFGKRPVAHRTARPSSHFAQEGHRLFVTAAVDQPRDLAPGVSRPPRSIHG